MRDFVRPVAAAFGIAGLAVAISVASNTDVFAQAKQQQMAPPQKQAPAQGTPPQAAQQPELKQIALTDKQIEGVLSAQKDMDAITDKIPDNAPPDPKIDAKNSAKHEPIVWLAMYGKGRICHNVLGHDVEAMQSPGFKVLLVRGIEWAARGETNYPLPTELSGK